MNDQRKPPSSSPESEEERDRDRRSESARAFFRHHRAKGSGYSKYYRPAQKARRQTPQDAEGLDVDDPPEEGARTWVAPPGTYRSKSGTGPSKWDPQPLGDLVALETVKRGWQHSLAVASVTADWEAIVGPQVAQHCPVDSFEGGVVIAQADSTAWAQQLQLLLPHIQRRIDEKVGRGVVEKVVVRPPRAPSWIHGKRSVKGRGPRDTYG